MTGVCDWSANASEGHDDGEVANSAAPSAWFPELDDDLADTEVIEITNEVEDQEIEFEAEATGPPQQLHAEKRPSTAAAVMDAGSEPGSQPSSPDQPNAHSIQSDPNSVEATSWGSLETDASAQQVEAAPRGALTLKVPFPRPLGPSPQAAASCSSSRPARGDYSLAGPSQVVLETSDLLPRLAELCAGQVGTVVHR